MNKEELIKKLLQHELNAFRFSVWATYSDDGGLEYALCLSGSKPESYDIHLCNIGGSSCIDYNYEYLEFVIDDAVDELFHVKQN